MKHGASGAGGKQQVCASDWLRGGERLSSAATRTRVTFKNHEIKTSNQRAPDLTSASAVALPLCFVDEKEDGKEVLCRSCAMRMMGGCASAWAATVAAASAAAAAMSARPTIFDISDDCHLLS